MRRWLLSIVLIVIYTCAGAQSFNISGTGVSIAAPWQSPAISADGSKIYVPTFPDSILGSPPGYYHSSNDYGRTWTKQTGSGNRFWVFGCASSDGTIVYGVDQGSVSGFIYKSIDSGITWSPTNFPSKAWQQVSCSSDGSKVAACIGTQVAQDVIFTSVDGGSTVVSQTNSLVRNWFAITMSGDGTKIAASNLLGSGANGDGKIYISTNWQTGSGSTWTGSNAAANGASVAQGLSYSRDGSTLYAAFNANGNTSHVFKTINDGGLWTDVNPPGGTAAQRSWYWIATSASGQKVVASNQSSASVFSLFVSSDAGSTWAAPINASPIGPSAALNLFMAVSDNGNVIVSSVYNGWIVVSTDGGDKWRITSATGP